MKRLSIPRLQRNWQEANLGFQVNCPLCRQNPRHKGESTSLSEARPPKTRNDADAVFIEFSKTCNRCKQEFQIQIVDTPNGLYLATVTQPVTVEEIIAFRKQFRPAYATPSIADICEAFSITPKEYWGLFEEAASSNDGGAEVE